MQVLVVATRVGCVADEVVANAVGEVLNTRHGLGAVDPALCANTGGCIETEAEVCSLCDVCWPGAGPDVSYVVAELVGEN